MSNLIEGNKLEVSPYGILGKATNVIDLDDSNGHWVSGFIYDLEDAGTIVKNLALGTGGSLVDDLVASIEGLPQAREYTPFTIEATASGTTLGVDPEVYAERAKKNLEVATQKAIEQQIWTTKVHEGLNGTYDDVRVSRGIFTDSVKISTTATSLEDGLSLIEESIAEGLGDSRVLHMPRRIASRLKLREYWKDGILRSNLGTAIVVGSGYNSYSIAETGPVTVVLGKIEAFPDTLNQSVDTNKNTVTYVAQRPVGVFWNTFEGHHIDLSDLL